MGTIKATWIDKVASATMPIKGGIKAPPAIEETIKPESSLVCSGMRSMVMEKINGKMLANPRPMRKMPIKVRENEELKIKLMPTSANSTVKISMRFGAIFAKTNDPRNLPTKIGR